MLPFWNLFEQAGRTRGKTAVLELAAFAALWPYISGGWTRLDPAYASFFFAISLFITLILLIGLRAAIAGMTAVPATFGDHAIPEATVVAAEAGTAVSVPAALPSRAAMIAQIEQHDLVASNAALGLIRFANHTPMVHYDAAGARRIMAMFAQRLKAAAGRRFIAQIADDAVGIWFESQTEDSADELKSLGYVMSQELSIPDLAVLPDIHLSLTTYSPDGHTPKSFIANCLTVCTPLKAFTGKSQVVDGGEEEPAYRFAMEQALRRAAREGELSLRYQPLVDTAVGKVVGAEVLLRWRHPGFGDVSPALFIPILEKTGLIHEVGPWILNSACRQLGQ